MDSSLPSENSENSLTKITIHYCDKSKLGRFLMQPVVCMHIIDSHLGYYTKKQDKNKAAVSYYETQRGDVDYIMPIMTQPCVSGNEKSQIPKWEESFLLNESLEYLVKKESSTILFFEILDTKPKSVTKDNYERLKETGLQKIAWSFLKLLGSNNAINKGEKLRLQLYKPLPSQKKKNSKIEVYEWWQKESKIPLDASLYVSVETCEVFSIEPALRSMLPFQKEVSIGAPTKSRERVSDNDESLLNTNDCSGLNLQNGSFQWSRKDGEICKIPTVNSQSFITANPCQLLKFSSGGRLLATGSGALNQYSISLFEIPSGKLLIKKLAHSDVIYDFDWSKDDNYLLSASGDYSAKLWCSRSWIMKASFVHPSFVYAAKFEPSLKNIICTACYDHVIRIWTYNKSVQILQELEKHSSCVNTLCWITSKMNLISADNNGQIIVWKITNSSKNTFHQDEIFERYIFERELAIQEIKCLSVEKIVNTLYNDELYIFCGDGIVRSVDYLKDKILFRYETSMKYQKYIAGCCSPCGTLFFLPNEDGSISVWNTKSQKKEAIIPNRIQPHHISYIDYHPLEHMLALSSSEENVPVQIYTYDNKDYLNETSECSSIINSKTCSSSKASDSSLIETKAHLNSSKKIEESCSQQKLYKPNTKKINQKYERYLSDSNSSGSKVNNNLYESDSSISHKSLENFETSEKSESLTAIITQSGQFDVIGLSDYSSKSDGYGSQSSISCAPRASPSGVTQASSTGATQQSSNDSSQVVQTNSKRAERRRKLKELNKR